MTTILEDARSECSAAVFADNWGDESAATEAAARALNLLETYLAMKGPTCAETPPTPNA